MCGYTQKSRYDGKTYQNMDKSNYTSPNSDGTSKKLNLVCHIIALRPLKCFAGKYCCEYIDGKEKPTN